jgi:SAM-dependent methyltransferase
MQLELCPKGPLYHPVLADWHDMKLPRMPEAAGVMFSSALCQMDTEVALRQAYDALKPGGVLMVNDMYRIRGDGREMEERLAARVMPLTKLLGFIDAAGFRIEKTHMPVYDDSHFQALLDESGMRHYAFDIRPVLVRAVK